MTAKLICTLSGLALALASAASADAPPPHDLIGVPVGHRSDQISWVTITNGPLPDTRENRAKYRPLSHAGRRSLADGR